MIIEKRKVIKNPKKMEIISHKKTNKKVIDYSIYTMTKKERLLTVLLASFVFYAIGYIFYQNHIISIILSLLGFLYPKYRTKQLILKRKQELTLQFKQVLYSLASSVTVGKSVENAFKDIIDDLNMIYPDPNTYIIQEINRINKKVENGETIENALKEFAERADVEDISSFADVFIISKRTGGDLSQIIRNASNIIGDKIEIQQDITIMIAQKKFESRILNLAPFAIVLLLSFSSPDYMAPLYEMNSGGSLVMTASLILLAISFFVSERMMRIKV